jgi:hypothetical protein
VREEWGARRPHWEKQGRGREAGNSSSTWHAAAWARWNTIWAGLWAELDIGPITKLVAHMKLYNFHLRFMVIRETD